MPLASVSDYENYIERLKLARRYIGEHIELMREGIRIGMTVPQVVLAGYEVTIESHVVDEAEASVFFRTVRVVPHQRAAGGAVIDFEPPVLRPSWNPRSRATATFSSS